MEDKFHELNSTQLNGYNYTLINSHFKTFLITLLSLTLLFSISCSNEDTTGGNSDSISSVAEDTYGNTNNITVISQTSSTVYSAGTVGFSVSGPSDYNVSIQSVNNGSNPLTLEPSDFSYNKSTKELTLSSSGLTKFQSSSASLTARQKYQYTITFKFETSSDSKTLDVNINLYKAEVITKTEIEAMIKSMKTVRVDDSSYKSVAQFSFSSEAFQSSKPNFKANNIGSTEKNIKFSKSSGRIQMGAGIKETANYKIYFSGLNEYLKEIADGANCTFYFRFTLKEGYALSSEVTHLTSDGLSIQLILSRVNSQTWE